MMPLPHSYDDLEVIGSTVVPEDGDLPLRLNPIYQRRGDSAVYYLPLDEERDAPPRLASEDPGHANALAAEGLAVFFTVPIQARQNHWLIQFAAGKPPEYLQADRVPIRLRAACETALVAAARALLDRRPDDAVEAAWYARRADGNDPLPTLALIGLLRREITPDELRLLEQDLKAYSSQAVDAARRRAEHQAELTGLASVIWSSGSPIASLTSSSTSARCSSHARCNVGCASSRLRMWRRRWKTR